MKSIPQTQRYLPHEITTREHAVKTYRSGNSIAFVCRKYKISKASLMRWNKRYDGTRESLMNRSHRPHTPHPKQHTDEELKMIKNILRRNPDISGCELYGKLKKKGYSRHPDSLYRVLRRLGYRDVIQGKCQTNFINTPSLMKPPGNGIFTLTRSSLPIPPLILFNERFAILGINQASFRPIMVRSLPIGWTPKEYILLTNSVQN